MWIFINQHAWCYFTINLDSSTVTAERHRIVEPFLLQSLLHLYFLLKDYEWWSFVVRGLTLPLKPKYGTV